MGLITPELLSKLELANGIPSGLLTGQIKQESSGNARAISKAGAMGLLQLMPATARELGVSDPYDPIQNVTAGAKYLGQQIKAFGGDVEKGLQAYNWGGGNMRSYLRNGTGAKGQAMPLETQQYVEKVMGKPSKVDIKALGDEIFPDSKPATKAPAKVDIQALGDEIFPIETSKRSWSDVPLEALSNVPESAAKFAGGIVHAVAHPIDTAGDVLDVGAGAIANLMPKTTGFLDKAFGTEKNTARTVTKADAVGQALKDRYGSKEGLKNTLATDPVGALADIATLATGGEAVAAKIPQLASTAKVLGKVANVTNPINAVAPVAKGVGKVVGNAGKQGLGLTTGTSAETIAQAAKSGFKNDQSFIDNLREVVPKSDLVDKLRSAIQTMKQNKSNAYKSGIATTVADTTPLKFDAIDTALADGLATTKSQHGMSLVNDADNAKLDELSTVVDQWRKTPAAQTASGLDELKKRIDAIPVDHVNANAASRIVSQVRNAVKKTIVDQSPEYAKTMAKYEAATALEKEISKAFSSGKNASIDTTLRKLQSLARDNVNTSYGYRAELADALKKGTGEDLMPAVAGQAASSWLPRGLARLTAGGAGVAGITNPLLWASLPFQSPRLMAEILYSGGKATGKTARAASKVSAPLAKAGVTSSKAKKIALLSSELGRDNQ